MQIVCPNCTTSYQIADVAVGATGRSVRCVRCRTIWLAMPPAVPAHHEIAANVPPEATVAALRAALVEEQPAVRPAPAPAGGLLDDLAYAHAPEAVTETAAIAPAEAPVFTLADIPIPVEDEPGSPPPALVDGTAPFVLDNNGPPDIESVAARRARGTARRRRSRFWVPLPVGIVALATLCMALLGWRKDIVRHAPQLASFYSAIGLPVNLRGLAFSDMKIGNEIHDGVPVLVVEGMIVSTVSKPTDVPRLRFALRSATGAEVYSWTAPPSQPVLGAFEAMPFRSRLASPPAEGHDIQVRYFTRRDAVASLR
jgi:predicted Zn finger-like uncharacterized protein